VLAALAQQILEDPDAADYRRWLNWAYWLILVICTGAVIAGAAAAWRTTNVESGRWGRAMILAGLAGALAAALIDQVISWSYELIVP
jgi:hypothetical protein